jgi:hypothetical protein
MAKEKEPTPTPKKRSLVWPWVLIALAAAYLYYPPVKVTVNRFVARLQVMGRHPDGGAKDEEQPGRDYRTDPGVFNPRRGRTD